MFPHHQANGKSVTGCHEMSWSHSVISHNKIQDWEARGKALLFLALGGFDNAKWGGLGWRLD